ncbi:MAG: sigma-70 family RNA polymerase sigma factor [Tannerella sp.]|jgi:RNA polymerase sigma-70 factor (ECF subfamily)|nr:sigma-70 family RNA polymerase sigma factor [Tannerella sp.]
MKNSDSLTENRFKAGDTAAIGHLYEATSDRLFRYGMKLLDNEDLVKDCIHDTFLKFLENRVEIPEDKSVLFYLFTILRNLIIDTIRRNEKVVHVVPLELPFHVEFEWNRDEDPSEEDMRERFEELVAVLSDRQKEAIYLRFYHDMSIDEISAILGITHQSVSNLMHRALEKIRAGMDVHTFLILFLSCC